MKASSSTLGLFPFALAFGVFTLLQSLLGYPVGYVIGYIDGTFGPGLTSFIFFAAFTLLYGSFFGLIIAWLYNHFRNRF